MLTDGLLYEWWSPMPDRPASNALQVDFVSVPMGVTSPIPVMTTRGRALCMMCSYPRAQTSSSNSSALFTAREVLLDIIDRILDETNVFGFVVGYLNVEFVLYVHHQFNEIEGVSPQILDKIGLGDDPIGLGQAVQ